MKWCMVAAIAVSLLFIFSGMAFAQGDDFDLDALLGDVGVDVAADAGSASPASQEAEVAEAFDDSMDAFAAEPAVEEASAEADPFASEPEVVADDFDADAFAEADATADAAAGMPDDPFAADMADDPFAAGAEDAFAEVAAPEAEDDFAAAEADTDILGDLLAEEPVEEAPAVAAAEPDFMSDLFGAEEVEAPAVDVEDSAGFEDMGLAEDDAEATFEDDSFETADFGSMAAPAAKAKKEELSPREVKKLAKEAAQQEEVRRQDAEAKAMKSAEAGFKALSEGALVEAQTSLSSALNTLPDRPQNDALRAQIAWGLAEAQYLQARDIIKKQGSLADARKLVDSALRNAPDHRGAQALSKRLEKLEAAALIPKAPADQPATLEKQKSIAQLYSEARQWYMLKDYNRAVELFEIILKRDPYHKSSMRYLRKIEEEKFKLATYERAARVQGMMTEVRQSWSPPARTDVDKPEDLQGPGGLDSKPASELLQQKMRELIIPAVEFRQANITDVVNFLVDASQAADPEKRGVNIILNLGASGGGGGGAPAPAPVAAATDDWGDFGMDDFDSPTMSAGGGGSSGVRDITLNLRRISLLDAIKYITEVANLKFRIEDSAVMITPVDAPVGQIITRMYPVQPSFMDVIVERDDSSGREGSQEFVSMSGRVNVTKSDVKTFFEKTGVQFPTGASITYNSAISQLIVANTADNLETFEAILQRINVIPNQVEIEARFIEVDQTDLEELGLQWILNDNYEFATKNDGSGQRLQANANRYGFTQGNRFFNLNTRNMNIEPASAVARAATQTPLGGILSISSVLTNPEVTVVLQALSQHGGTDLLSAPRVTTRSGVNAQIQVVKEIIYPTEFSVTQPSVNSEGLVTMGPISEPGTFQTRETGVILNVTPTVGPDGYTIDLVMAPEVAELVDWIQYGSAIEIPSEFGLQIWNYNMPQPIFTSRNVTTSIVIWDGQTVVMGGLIREELTTIKDKVPILGDIPLLGWLFRSEGSYSRKKNLLIFVTARLVDPAGRPIHSASAMAMPGGAIEAAAATP